MNSIIGFWNAVVESAALVAIVVIALGLMVRLIELGRALRLFGSAIAALVLLVMLPAILVGIWRGISRGQKIEVVAACLVVGIVASQKRDHHPKPGKLHR